MDAIRKQVEFYFSDSNFRKDAFLKAASEADAERYVPIATLLSFNKLKALTTDAQEVSDALMKSDSVEVSADGLKLRRRATLPENDTSNERTVYVKGFPTDDESINSDSIAEQFSSHGKVLMTRMRREKNCRDFKGSVFIEFETEEAAKKCVAAANVDGEVKLAYKGVPFLCVMPFNDWYKAKQTKWEGRKNKTEESASNKRKREEVQYTKGLIFHVTGLPTDANTLHLKGFFKTIADVKFVEYTLGETSAHLRTSDADAAATLKAAFDKGEVTYVVEATEDGPAASTSKLSATVLADEEEANYWGKIESQAKSHKGGKGGRGGGRGGRGGGRGGRGGRGFKRGRN